MIFNSVEFFVFLPLVYLIYCKINHRAQNIFLLAASYVFYGWWDVRFLYLITLSTSVDYCCGLLIRNNTISRRALIESSLYAIGSAVCFVGFGGVFIGHDFQSVLCTAGGGVLTFFVLILLIWFLQFQSSIEPGAKFWVGFSVVVNLSILGVFKYYGFFIDSASDLLYALGFSGLSLKTLDVLLPVGISFYTFQTMSYSIDIYRKKLDPSPNYLDFALFVSYFPQLVAGPIERASHLLPKIIETRKVSIECFTSGVRLIAFGMFKKVVIADGLAGTVESVYGSSSSASSFDVLFATFFFAIQIYCDFSGYSDIARGTSRLFGIELMRNFNLPYFSRSPSEFWQRWHISLSSWLRDYLYIPLGGNRSGVIATYKNLSLTMILGGLWHGAAWNYILWGMYHGGLLIVYRLIPRYIISSLEGIRFFRWVGFWFSMLLFFCFTLYGWLLFRATSLDQIVHFTKLIVCFDSSYWTTSMQMPPFSSLMGLPILLLYECSGFYREYAHQNPAWITPIKPILVGGMIFIFIASLSTPPAQFIYFQF